MSPLWHYFTFCRDSLCITCFYQLRHFLIATAGGGLKRMLTLSTLIITSYLCYLLNASLM